MSRLQLDMPDSYDFRTELSVRISDINYGNHLGNDSLVSLLHEARVRMFRHHGFQETDVDGKGIIMATLAVIYRAEAFFGDRLVFELGVTEIGRSGCDICYRVTHAATAGEVALAKTGIVFFDYARRKVARVPDVFRQRFQTT